MQPAPSVCSPQPSTSADDATAQRNTTEAYRALCETCIEYATSRAALSVRPDISIFEATQQLLDAGVEHAPVITQKGLPVGILSQSDLLAAWRDIARGTRTAVPSLSTAPLGASSMSLGATFVSEVMMPYVLAVKTSDPLSLAANLMAYEGVSQLLVLDSDKKYVGVVTAQNILNWVARLSITGLDENFGAKLSTELESVGK